MPANSVAELEHRYNVLGLALLGWFGLLLAMDGVAALARPAPWFTVPNITLLGGLLGLPLFVAWLRANKMWGLALEAEKHA